MTHDEMIAVIQAHKQGKTIQFLYGKEEWVDLSGSMIFNFQNTYRIKPEPLGYVEGKEVHPGDKLYYIGSPGYIAKEGDNFCNLPDWSWNPRNPLKRIEKRWIVRYENGCEGVYLCQPLVDSSVKQVLGPFKVVIL